MTCGDQAIEEHESPLTFLRPFPEGIAGLAESVITFRYALGEHPTLAAREWPDRVRLPLTFDRARLAASLSLLDTIDWTSHFVTENYSGTWSVIPLRAPAGTETQHPILQIVSHPGATTFVDTPVLALVPYLGEVLRALPFPIGAARLMRLDPGSVIHTHTDPDLEPHEGGSARLHIPIRTNPDVEFMVNGTRVVMHAGECWYVRLSDPHSVRNDGAEPRVHLVIDAPAGPELARLISVDSTHGITTPGFC